MRLRRPTFERGPVAVPGIQRAAAKVTPDFRLALIAALVAIAALVVDGVAGGTVHGSTVHAKVIAGACAAGFVVFSVISIRRFAHETYRVLEVRTGPGHAGVVRWVILVASYIIMLLVTLGILDVPISHLVVGGALTGVVLGIAAQQALGNVFAGVVLLLSRPFNVGETIRVRSGALGGEFYAVVTGMGMTYVELVTDDGRLSVPNSMMLAAAVGPLDARSGAGLGPGSSRPVGVRPPAGPPAAAPAHSDASANPAAAASNATTAEPTL